MAMNVQSLEFRHLRCFAALADELHFGRAAGRLAMTLPPLSMAIRQLEELVGARLFERNSRGVRLTAAGDAFRAHARTLLAGAEEACTTAREVGAGATGRIKVGMVGMLLYRGLPRWLQQFGREHPRIEVALVELNSQQQLEALARGKSTWPSCSAVAFPRASSSAPSSPSLSWPVFPQRIPPAGGAA